MDIQTYKDQLKEFGTKYKSWWYEPFEKFMKEHRNELKSSQGFNDYHRAREQFKEDLRKQYDLLSEIYDFLDLNYEVYLQATSEDQAEMRTIIKNTTYISYQSGVVNFMEDLLLEYVRDRVIQKLKSDKDINWLLRGLTAISLENCGIDYRDTYACLTDLCLAADEQGIIPEKYFLKVAEISSHETPRGGSTPMNEMMAKVSTSILNDQISKKN